MHALTSDDPSVDAANAIAAVAKEELIVVGAGEGPRTRSSHAPPCGTGLTVRRDTVSRAALSDPTAIGIALRQIRELLIVTSRNAFAPRIASTTNVRRVPILIIEPKETLLGENEGILIKADDDATALDRSLCKICGEA